MTGGFRSKRALAAVAVVAAATAAAVAAVRSRRGHEHEWVFVGRWVYRGPGMGFGMPQTVRYRWCECEEMRADVLPGMVPLLAMQGFRTDEVRAEFDRWADANADLAGVEEPAG
jgi:hypothetical protein